MACYHRLFACKLSRLSHMAVETDGCSPDYQVHDAAVIQVAMVHRSAIAVQRIVCRGSSLLDPRS